MLEENNCLETPQIALEGTPISKAEKILQAQHSIIGVEDRKHYYEPEIEESEPYKTTTIRISHSTKEKLDSLKIDRESYESVILRLIERSAAKACCAARWM